MMRNVSCLFLLFLASMLQGCSSQTLEEDKLYRLAPLPIEMVQAGVDLSLPLVLIKPAKLNSLLDQPMLVYQHSDHGLQVAYGHRWAEDLDVAVNQSLLRHLNSRSDKYRYQLYDTSLVRHADYVLILEVEYFNGLAEGAVLNSGYLSVYDNGQNLLARQAYREQQKQEERSYESMVSALHQSFAPVSVQVRECLRGLP